MSARKAPAATKRTRTKPTEAFPAVEGEVAYGVDPTKEPVLYRDLEPVVKEAIALGGTSSWRSTNGKPVSQIRRAAARWGYRVNVSTARVGDVEVTTVFRLVNAQASR